MYNLIDLFVPHRENFTIVILRAARVILISRTERLIWSLDFWQVGNDLTELSTSNSSAERREAVEVSKHRFSIQCPLAQLTLLCLLILILLKDFVNVLSYVITAYRAVSSYFVAGFNLCHHFWEYVVECYLWARLDIEAVLGFRIVVQKQSICLFSKNGTRLLYSS